MKVSVFLRSNKGGTPKHEGKSSTAMSACKLGHTFYHCSAERKASVLDHKGCNSSGTNEESCLLMHLRHQPKQSLDEGHSFHAWGVWGGCPSLCCPAHTGTFLVTIQSLSVYTISGAE